MLSNSKKFSELLIEHGLSLRKSLGQNFLVDPNIPKKIVRLAGITSECNVLEIGPGIGALTTELCEAAGYVVAVELDLRLLPLLNDVLEPFDNYKLIHGDILKLDLNKVIDESPEDARWVVCANLPYSITTPILTLLLECMVFDEITVMIQKEVARRICAKPGTTDYGAFSVFINYHSMPKILFDVPPECFIPQPKVYSSVVRMSVRENKLLEPTAEKFFFRVVRAAFEQRRKTLVNALYSAFKDSLNKNDIEEAVKKSGFALQVRGEMLSLEQFVDLSNILNKVTI